MTLEETSEILKSIKLNGGLTDKDRQALNVAIQMLETGEVYMTGDDYNLFIKGYKAGMKDYKSLVEESDPADSDTKVRLINANALLRRIDEEREYLKARGQLGAEHILVHNFRELVETAPTVDAIVNTIEVRPQGKWRCICDTRYWQFTYEHYECTKCHYKGECKFKHCPSCGAEMIQGGKEE